MFQDALQKSKMGIFYSDFEHWQKARNFWERAMQGAAATMKASQNVQGQTRPYVAPSPQPSGSSSMPLLGDASGASSDISGMSMRPGLRQEDLKQPPARRTRTVSKPPSAAPSPQVFTIESPGKTPVNATSPDIVELSPPKSKNIPLAAGKNAPKAAQAQRGNLKRARSVSGQSIVEEKKPSLTREDAEMQKRQKLMKEAETDPILFLEKAWKDLNTVASSKGDDFASTSSLIKEDVSCLS